MSRISTCTACQFGDHSRHRQVIKGVSKGMVGGVVCSCRGECEEVDEKERLRRLSARYGLPMPNRYHPSAM